MRNDINARLIGFRNSMETKKLLIQVDGVPYEIINKALKKRYMPNLKRSLKYSGYKLFPFYSELPSNTPAAQMKIMYGISGLIKGFRWYSKSEKRHYTFKDTITAKYWEEKAINKHKKMVVKDGASYVNMFSGGAKRNILIFSRMLDTNISMRVVNNFIWKFIFLNADFIVRVTKDVIKEFIVEIYEHLKYKIKKRPQRPMNAFPYVRVGNNVFFKEIATMGAIIEMNEMAPVIYLTYTGYDEVAHQRGPETTEAISTLRSIDRTIGKLLKMAQKKGYEVFIFSDHGQSSTTPFKDIFHKELEEEIISLAGIKESVNTTQNGSTRDIMFLCALKKLFGLLIRLGKKVTAGIIKKVFKKSIYGLKKEKIDIARKIIAENSGPLSHIYFNEIEKRAYLEEINEIYNDITDKILLHKGIEFGVVKLKDGFLLKGRFGEIITNNFFDIKEEKGDIFQNIVDIEKELLLNSIKEIATGDDSGDLILFGAILSKNRCVNFEIQYGGHGGIGGMQNKPFIMMKRDLDKDISISDLYSLFES